MFIAHTSHTITHTHRLTPSSFLLAIVFQLARSFTCSYYNLQQPCKWTSDRQVFWYSYASVFSGNWSTFMEKKEPKKNSNEASNRFRETFFVCSPFDVRTLIRTIYSCMMTITSANDFVRLIKRRCMRCLSAWQKKKHIMNKYKTRLLHFDCKLTALKKMFDNSCNWV